MTLEVITNMRATCAELTQQELDLLIMGQLMGTTFDDKEIRLNSRHQPQERKRAGAIFLYNGLKKGNEQVLFSCTMDIG